MITVREQPAITERKSRKLCREPAKLRSGYSPIESKPRRTEVEVRVGAYRRHD
jgi:hypothetical protein